MFFGFLGWGVIMFACKDNKIVLSWAIVRSVDLKFFVSILLDRVSIRFIAVLLIIRSNVMNFGVVYMHEEKKVAGFFWVLLSFIFSMFMLIVSPNLFFLLVGWDGLGVRRFILIVYYLSGNSWSAGFKTYVTNRLGDGFLLVSIGLLFYSGNLDLLTIGLRWCAGLLLVIGLLTKRAQFPFSFWLPLAMEAPTPVSALVHSSTLVTAGVFVLIRVEPMLRSFVLSVVRVISLWTLFIARFAACFEYDSKKIVAYSTLSQLGFMCLALGLGYPLLAFIHLVVHALFKSLLFIRVGFFIIRVSHFQDLRVLKRQVKRKLVNKSCCCIRIIVLRGFPFLSAFFSKDLILERFFGVYKIIFFSLVILSVGFTCFYSIRLFCLLKDKTNPCSVGKSGMEVSFGKVFVLLSFSIAFGSFLGWGDVGSSFSFHLEKFTVILVLLFGSIVFFGLGKFFQESFFFSTISFLKKVMGFSKFKMFLDGSSYIKKTLDLGFRVEIINWWDSVFLSTGKILYNKILWFDNVNLKYCLFFLIFLFLVFLILI